MPARTERQRRFFAAEYGRAKAGKHTRTKMTQAQRRHFMTRPKGGFRRRQAGRGRGGGGRKRR